MNKDLKSMKTELIVDGMSIQGLAESIAVVNPANEEIIAEVPSANADQVQQAVIAAIEAFKT